MYYILKRLNSAIFQFILFLIIFMISTDIYAFQHPIKEEFIEDTRAIQLKEKYLEWKQRNIIKKNGPSSFAKSQAYSQKIKQKKLDKDNDI